MIFSKLRNILFIFSMLLFSCSDGNNTPIEEEPEVITSEITIESSIISNGLNFSNEKGEQSITFSTNENWTLNVASTPSGATWCKPSITSGGKGNAIVTFTVEENSSYESRSVSVTIKSGTISKTFTITQKYAEALLLTSNKYEITQEGGNIDIEVKSNIEYTYAISETAKDWITPSSTRSLTSKKHTFNIAFNENSDKREGEIVFKSGTKTEVVKVYQSGGAILLLSNNEYQVSDIGDTISVDIKSNIEYGIHFPNVDWIISETSTRALSSHTLKYIVCPNDNYESRSSEIIFYDKNSELSDTIRIIQAQKDAIIISQKEFELPCEGGNIRINLKANIDYTYEIAENAKEWIKEVNTRALQEYKHEFIIASNESEEMRQGEIYFKSGTLIDTIKVNQTFEIPYITFHADSEQSLTMSKGVETLEYSVNNGEWKLLDITTVNFGGELGDLRLRGKSSTGTNGATIQFGYNIPVACSGDIRTLIEYEKYNSANTEEARFSELFRGCDALTTAPQLPIMTLANGCYMSMFNECSNLTEAPELPATTLADMCYQSMFYKCSKLETPPELPAMTLAERCYGSIFGRCSNLKTAPKLPATTLTKSCYQSMFVGCINLIEMPELKATTLAESCYSSMFRDCSNLTITKELPASTLAKQCYSRMFENCINLTTAPIIAATTLADMCYQSMFYKCSKLETSPELPATTLAKYCYYRMFDDCTSLRTAPSILPATTLAAHCYDSMFRNCKNLETPPELPATTLDIYCYSRMFELCDKLKCTPKLAATTLTKGCYSGMFGACSSLFQVTMLATDISAPKCLENWLSLVAEKGVFYKDSTMTSLPEGESGIPIGWEIKNYIDSN